MDLVPPKDSPDKLDARPSFRKPSNDSTTRKYRHHSPVDGSNSSSSGDSFKHEQHSSPGNSLANRSKLSDERGRKYHGKEPERNPGHSHSSKGSDSYRNSDKQAHRSQHSDDGGYLRLADDEDRDSARYSKYGRELRIGRSDCANLNDSLERSKETSRTTDRNAELYHYRDKYENSGHRSSGRDRESNGPDHRYNEKEFSRAASGSRQMTSGRDNKRVDERERRRERDDRDDRRIQHRSPSDYRKEYASNLADCRHDKDSFLGRETVGHRQKESQRKELDEKDYQVQKRRYNDKDIKKQEEKYSLDPGENRKKESDSFSVDQAKEEKSHGYVDKNSNSTEEQSSSSKRLKLGQSDKFSLNMAEGKQSSSSKQINNATEKFTLGTSGSANKHNEAVQDLNAAKVAAMKAAELGIERSRSLADQGRFFRFKILLVATICLIFEYYNTYISKRPRMISPFVGDRWIGELLTGHPRRFHNMFRMSQSIFIDLLHELQSFHGLCGLLRTTPREVLGITLYILSHNESVRATSERFQHSTETISRYFTIGLESLVSLSRKIVKPMDHLFTETPKEILYDQRYMPFFKDCIGAIDGTHVDARVSDHDKIAYIGRCGSPTQNIMAICDFNMCFTFIMVGWEGSAHDNHIFKFATRNEQYNFPMPPAGKYYLADAAYPMQRGFLKPYSDTKYHIPDFQRSGQVAHGRQEMFNKRHSSLHSVIERSFGVWKKKWIILRDMPSYPFKKQTKIVTATVALHNYIRRHNSQDDPDFNVCDMDESYVPPEAYEYRVGQLFSQVSHATVSNSTMDGEGAEEMLELREQIASTLVTYL